MNFYEFDTEAKGVCGLGKADKLTGNKTQIQYKNINDIKPYDRNPRKNDDAVKYVAESIRQFGFKVPIVIDRNGTIVAGHTRYKAAKKIGMSEVPCIIADDLTEEQIKAYRMADNKVSEFAEWDIDLLGEELGEITDIDMTDFGFEINIPEENAEFIEDEFDETLPEKPKSKLGEIYQMGRHRLMCGDGTDAECVKKLVGGVHVDLLLTDPPYNVDYEGKTKDKLKIQNDKMDDEKFREFLRSAFFCADSVMKPGAVFYIWHADLEGYNFRGA